MPPSCCRTSPQTKPLGDKRIASHRCRPRLDEFRPVFTRDLEQARPIRRTRLSEDGGALLEQLVEVSRHVECPVTTHRIADILEGVSTAGRHEDHPARPDLMPLAVDDELVPSVDDDENL